LTICRWPTGLTFYWRFLPGRSIRALYRLPFLIPPVVFASAWFVFTVGNIDWPPGPWHLPARGVLLAYTLRLMFVWPSTPDVPALTATRLRAKVDPREPSPSPLIDKTVRAHLNRLYKCIEREDGPAVQRLLGDPIAARIPTSLRVYVTAHGANFVHDHSKALSILDEAIDQVSLGLVCGLYVDTLLLADEAGQSPTADQVQRARDLLTWVPRIETRDSAAGLFARFARRDNDLAGTILWGERACAWAHTRFTEGEALLTLATAYARHGWRNHTRKAIRRARRLHPECMRWPVVLREIADSGVTSSTDA